MEKRAAIDAIRNLNPTAGPEFLSAFTTEELSRYLDRLSHLTRGNPAAKPFGPLARPPVTTAVVATSKG